LPYASETLLLLESQMLVSSDQGGCAIWTIPRGSLISLEVKEITVIKTKNLSTAQVIAKKRDLEGIRSAF